MNELTNDLQSLIEDINNGVAVTTKELAEASLDYMRKEYMENNMSRHTKNLSVTSYKSRYKNGFLISSGDDLVATFNELGTGIVGEGTGVLADTFNYQYNLPSLKKGVVPDGAIAQYAKRYKVSKAKARTALQKVTTPSTWWYFKKGTWRHTEGMRGKNMFASLFYELQQSAAKQYSYGITNFLTKYRRRK